MEGTVDCETDLRIEGRIRGSIRCSRNITIGETGVVFADVEGVSVVIAGSLTGDVIASGSLLIEATGQLNGNATCSAFIIKDGGQFNGTSSMGEANKASASVSHDSGAAVSASERRLARTYEQEAGVRYAGFSVYRLMLAPRNLTGPLVLRDNIIDFFFNSATISDSGTLRIISPYRNNNPRRAPRQCRYPPREPRLAR